MKILSLLANDGLQETANKIIGIIAPTLTIVAVVVALVMILLIAIGGMGAKDGESRAESIKRYGWVFFSLIVVFFASAIVWGLKDIIVGAL